MFQKLEAVETRCIQLDKYLSDSEVINNQERFQKYAKERSELSELLDTYRIYRKVCKELEESEQLLSESDEELRQLAKSESLKLEEEKELLENKLKYLLLPSDSRDEKNVLLEIRAGTGGEEAAIFVSDLFKMYFKYAEKKGWKVEIMSQNVTGLGGFKEIIALIEGKKVYSRFKHESGVHRVQRVPETESQGRIHTSAITVAVLPEAEDVDVEIDPNDLKIDVFRSSGPGGQHVNKTDSAVRMTHLPSGLVVSCQDEKSQHKNKAKALKILRARLLDKAVLDQQSEISQDRKDQVGSGDRSERIRTYNFPQGRVTDHRIKLTLHNLEKVLEGELDDFLDQLTTHFQTESIKEAASSYQ
ncbi:MAG: peptide chain release factor 1 [Deltaproteobacteria bacterium]|jgi:peptide chain release factor 1|nr:peptide chain release factor 1 [Deltaproteobacteria bacterium]